MRSERQTAEFPSYWGVVAGDFEGVLLKGATAVANDGRRHVESFCSRQSSSRAHGR